MNSGQRTSALETTNKILSMFNKKTAAPTYSARHHKARAASTRHAPPAQGTRPQHKARAASTRHACATSSPVRDIVASTRQRRQYAARAFSARHAPSVQSTRRQYNFYSSAVSVIKLLFLSVGVSGGSVRGNRDGGLTVDSSLHPTSDR